jgi:hypothetical protein
MPNPPGGDPSLRRYDDGEVRELLARAARVQVRRPTPRAVQGMTLAELEEVAAEAGIDVAELRQAARELDAERRMLPTGAASRLAGAPLRVHAERVLPFELDDDALGALVDALSAGAGQAGDASLIGRTLIWQSQAASGRRTTARIAVRPGSTHIRVEERYGEIAGGLFGGVLGGVGGGVGIGAGTAIGATLGSTVLMFGFPLAIIGGSYAACRYGFAAYVRRRARSLNDLCEQLADAAAQRAPGE